MQGGTPSSSPSLAELEGIVTSDWQRYALPCHATVRSPVTVKTFGLLQDRAGIWLDFPDFKHDYIKDVYWSDLCFASRGPRTGSFHSDCDLIHENNI